MEENSATIAPIAAPSSRPFAILAPVSRAYRFRRRVVSRVTGSRQTESRER